MRNGSMRVNARKLFLKSNSRVYTLTRSFGSVPRLMNNKYPPRLIKIYLANSLVGFNSQRTLHGGSNPSPKCCFLRLYSSESDGKIVEESKEMSTSDEKQDENKSFETRKLSVFSPRGERFRKEFLNKIVPLEKIPDISLDSFPYYIPENTKTALVECAASHLKETKARKYAARLKSLSNRILLKSIPGTELYRERLVSGIAREFQVPLMKLGSYCMPPYTDSEWFEGRNPENKSESESESETDTDTDTGLIIENDTSDEESRDDSDDNEEDEKSTDHDSDEDEDHEDDEDEDDTDKRPLRRGCRVKYVGPTISIKELNNRTLTKGQRGELFEKKGDKIAVVFNVNGLGTKEAENDMKNKDTKSVITWLDAEFIRRDGDTLFHDCYIAMEVLCEVLESQQPIVVYCSDCFDMLSWNCTYEYSRHFDEMLRKIFDQVSGRVVLFCGVNERSSGIDEIEKFPDSVKQYVQSLKAPSWNEEARLKKIFTNVVYIKPPEDEELLNTLAKQIEEDRKTVISQGNLSELNKVLKKHGRLAMDLEKVKIDDMILKRKQAEEVVGWATNHYISSCPVPCIVDDRLHVSHESLKLALLRLNKQKTDTKGNSKSNVKDLAKGEYEKQLISAVVKPSDISITFDDVGALDEVKKTLNEIIILPMRRPELFSHGNLLRPCKGMLLFGPPGTGKTLIAKALAKEAGANFINVTPASLGSKWYGDSENLAKALFIYARKLAPAIIFMDEIDALLGARGGGREHTATRAMCNEIMSGWDGLMSKEKERIIVIGTTNRPFDIDDAVIRRMPRRIYVGLPDVANRSKILKILLAKENLESGFCFEQLAEATEGYSGSDLKNLCVAAAYIPVQEILEKESKGEVSCDGVPAIRALNVNDFIHSKTKVGASVAYNSKSIMELRKWNEQYGEGGIRRKSTPI